MELWHAWTGLLQQMLQTLATDWGLGAGLAVVVLTLAMRTALLPLTWSLALRAAARRQKLAMLTPTVAGTQREIRNGPTGANAPDAGAVPTTWARHGRWQNPARRNRADAADLGPLSDFEKRSGTCGVSVGPESRAPRYHPGNARR
jgi:hypothetical protein